MKETRVFPLSFPFWRIPLLTVCIYSRKKWLWGSDYYLMRWLSSFDIILASNAVSSKANRERNC